MTVVQHPAHSKIEVDGKEVVVTGKLLAEAANAFGLSFSDGIEPHLAVSIRNVRLRYREIVTTEKFSTDAVYRAQMSFYYGILDRQVRLGVVVRQHAGRAQGPSAG